MIPVKLYLVQHGEAKNKEEDPERPLTNRGVEEVKKVASSIIKAKPSIEVIKHSEKLRAKQTAEIFSEYLNVAKVETIDGLAPLDDVGPMAEELVKETKNLMLVGHLPFLDRLTAKLLNGDPDNSVIKFRKGGVVCLEQDQEKWKLSWMIIPEIVRGCKKRSF